ncbi:MAG: serine protease [Planctomycetia bacterium]|nr:serine protease [Planctomycetia bacterium]
MSLKRNLFGYISLLFLWGLMIGIPSVFGQELGSFTSSDSLNSGKIQSEYPAIAKIVGRGTVSHNEKKLQDTQSVYYGSGVYVAELNDLGIVITNWHVVCDSVSSIEVKFPSFSSEGRVLLADEVWDLAAIVIRKPPFVPIPISLEVPQPNDELWVAGYGQSSGLEDFRMSSGKVLRYMILGVRENLPAETIALGVGVRQGDSGGPVLNQYGELAGILWGSNGKETMSTFCLRLQAFLTQAQFQLINTNLASDQIFEQFRIGSGKKISKASTPAQTALQASGIYPISSVPVYLTGKKVSSSRNPLNGGTIPSMKGIPMRHPPYPPIESPTLLAQRQVIQRESPEVYPEDAPYIKRGKNENILASAENIQTEESLFRNPSGNPRNSGSNPLKKDTSNGQNIPIPQMAKNTTTSLDSSGDSPEKSSENKETKELPGLGFLGTKSNIQMIIVVCMILFLFFNSVRFLCIAREK